RDERERADDPEEDEVRELVQLEEPGLPEPEREAHVHEEEEAEGVALRDRRQHPEDRRPDDAEDEAARPREDADPEPAQRRARSGVVPRAPPLHDRERDREE